MSINWNSDNDKSATNSLLARWESYRYGADLYAAREPLSRCHNAESRRGWWDSLNAEALASLPANCVEKLGF